MLEYLATVHLRSLAQDRSGSPFTRAQLLMECCFRTLDQCHLLLQRFNALIASGEV
jgi:hypothetical protein